MTQERVDAIEAELTRPYWRASDHGLWKSFWKAREADRRNTVRKGFAAAISVYILFSALDVFVVPDVAAYTIAARFVVAILSLAILEWQFRKNAAADVLDLVCASGIVLGFLGWVIPASFTIEQSVGEYYRIYGAVFMIGANLFFAFRAAVALTTCLSILLTLSATIFFSGQGGTIHSLIFVSFYFSCFFFTSYVAMKLENERYRAFLNSHRANLLQRETQAQGQALLKLSYTDALTNVHNRRSVDVKLHEFWSRWQTERRSFAAILVDVDFFKNFNDQHGHQQGDKCLVEVANSLASVAESAGGLVGRYGGEEFIILAPVQISAAAESLAETVRRMIQQLGIEHGLRRDGQSVVTVSVGVSYTRSDSTANLERIVHEADRALYAAKSDGRNCVKLFDPKDPHNDDMNETVAALLKIAVERKLVSLVYQPIHGVESGRLEAVESLMRLKSLDGTTVPPSMFIPVAERTGAIVTLGNWAIRTVCRDALAAGMSPVASVNVSAVQLRNPGFTAAVASILMETGVMGSRLALEITEGFEIDMDLVVLNCIADLKRLGVRIWLDDFGTGFAGLSWLRTIEFDTVKIDKSFLHDINEPKGRLMFLDIIALVRNRGSKILVEGIETADQLEFAQTAGLHQVQGYHVGRPTALSDIDCSQNRIKSSIA